MDVTKSTISTTRSSTAKSDTSAISESLEGFETTILEYASSTSAHGVTYIFETGRWAIERFFGTLVVGFAIIFRHAFSNFSCSFLIDLFINEFIQNSIIFVITSILITASILLVRRT